MAEDSQAWKRRRMMPPVRPTVLQNSKAQERGQPTWIPPSMSQMSRVPPSSVVLANHLTDQIQRKRRSRAQYSVTESSVIEQFERIRLAPPSQVLAASHVGSVVSYTDKGRVNNNPRTFEPGEIIWTPHILPSLDPTANLTQSHVGWTRDTGPVVGKMRPAIVVAIYDRVLTCLPVFTSQGRGFRSDDADSCMWVRHVDDDGFVWKDVDESKYLMLEPPTRLKESSFIRLTFAFTVQLEGPITKAGHLTHDSYNRLLDIWHIMVRKGVVPLNQQAVWAKERIDRIKLPGELVTMRQNLKEGFTTVKGKKNGQRR